MAVSQTPLWLQRQEEHFLLMFLGRFSRPRSGILIGSSEEEREAVTRGINWKRQKRAENNISGEGKAGGLCGSSKEGAKLGTPWPDLVLVKDQLRGEGRMVVGVAPQGPPSSRRGYFRDRPSRSPLSPFKGLSSPLS